MKLRPLIFLGWSVLAGLGEGIRYPDPAGRPVLCQGAVYSFRKFEAQETPQTREWKETESKRAWPDWTRPIVAPAIEREPDPEQ